jgi:hypothetical protein
MKEHHCTLVHTHFDYCTCRRRVDCSMHYRRSLPRGDVSRSIGICVPRRYDLCMKQSYGRIVFILFGVGVAIYACWKISQRIDAYLYPWADEHSGHAVLTGAWVGELVLDRNHRQAVLLELHRWHPPRSEKCPTGCNTIEGVLTTCDQEGLESNYNVTGRPADRRATHFSLQATPGPNPPIDFAGFDVLKGRWTGVDIELDLQLRAGSASPDVHRSISASAGASARMQLHRGAQADLSALCQIVHTH